MQRREDRRSPRAGDANVRSARFREVAERTGALGHFPLPTCGDRAHWAGARAGLRDGSAQELGQLLVPQQSVPQLAPHSRPDFVLRYLVVHQVVPAHSAKVC